MGTPSGKTAAQFSQWKSTLMEELDLTVLIKWMSLCLVLGVSGE